MNTSMRALVVTLGFLRLLPATVYITFGILCTAFIGLAGPAWEGLASLLSLSLTLYGGYRGIRRQRALSRFTRWTP